MDTNNTFAVAFHTTARERAALQEDDLEVINVTIPTAITIAKTAIARTRSLVSRIEHYEHDVDVGAIAKIELYADALWQAQVRSRLAIQDRLGPRALLRHGVALRRHLVVDLQLLTARGLLDPAVLTKRRFGNGYKNVALDLLGIGDTLGKLLAANPSSGIRSADVDEAIHIGTEISTQINEDAASARARAVIDAADDRRRAYTLLVRAYDQLRCVVSFLRWRNGDAERLAPALHNERRRRRPRASTPTLASNTNHPIPITQTDVDVAAFTPHAPVR
jgi:hypothetical protein